MNNKQATFAILDKTKSGDEFSGYDLMQAVKTVTGKTLYPATSLRYLREYREKNNIKIVNINKRRSLYRIVG